MRLPSLDDLFDPVLHLAKRWNDGRQAFGARVPAWFRRNGVAPASIAAGGFLYQPWIPEHTDKLIDIVGRQNGIAMVNLDMLADPDDKQRRMAMLRFAEVHEALYARMALHKLLPHQESAAGLIVTLDWIPAMRGIVTAAARIGLPTILVPHESVFADRSRYYRHNRLGIDTPACDVVLAWGETQRSIFIERGYPAERIRVVGAPKFDYIHPDRLAPLKGRARALGFDPARPIVCFAAQPLDSQFDMRAARRAQNRAITDLVDICGALGLQLIIRTPPSKDRILDRSVLASIAGRPDVFVDDANLYLLTAEETIAVSDVMVSINSTMLLEAAIAGRVAISTRYVDFRQLWEALNIPIATDGAQLREALETAVRTPEAIRSRYDLAWAAREFGAGSFDGLAGRRIAAELRRIAAGRTATMAVRASRAGAAGAAF